MERFVKGDIVVLPFPFSDLSATKKRPALIVANLVGDDFIVVQVTSVQRFDDYSLKLIKNDFEIGGLPQESMIRPNRLFTLDKSLVSYKIGTLNKSKIKDVEAVLLKILIA